MLSVNRAWFDLLNAWLTRFPRVALLGVRQGGKTTLLRDLPRKRTASGSVTTMDTISRAPTGPPPRARRLAGSLAFAFALGFVAASSAARGATVYVDGPGASDAQKIATQMLNDAAAGRWRGNQFQPAPNPFTAMIEQYENRRRARALDMEAAAREARERLAEREAEERRWREEEARTERARREWARIGAVQREAAELNPMAHIRLGMILESGRYDPDVVKLPPGQTARQFARERYAQASRLDLPLGEIAHACSERDENPSFPTLWEALQGLPDAAARRAHLERLGGGGHVGAAFWLGAWAAGRNVGLGTFPPLPGNAATREYALDWLSRPNLERLLIFHAELVLQGDPEPSARRRAIELLERFAVPGDNGDFNAYIGLARTLLREARLESDMARPRKLLGAFQQADIVPGMHALAAMHLDGTDGLFRPAQAAKVYSRMPEKPRFLALRGAARIFEGLDAILGVERAADAATALERFSEAERILTLAPGAYRASDVGLKVESILWRQFARAEAGETGAGLDDPVEFLMEHANDGRGLGRLLFRCALLGRPTTSAIQASTIWGFIRTESPFTAPLSPAQVLLHLQCAIRAHDRGAAPELAPEIEALRTLAPREAPIRGAALLARLAFLPGRLGRDSADHRGLAQVYGALFRAAWRDPALWGETAALLEVLQVDPLEDKDWTRGWLAPWLNDPSERARQPRAWAEVLRQPSAAAWKAATGRPWGRLVESLLSDSTSALPPPLAALRDSLQLRAATEPAVANAAFLSLLALGRAGHWHAQALLEDFETRYRPAYLRRGSVQLFRVHAREVAETLAAWRVEGFGFCRRDVEARWRAVGQAVETGSIRFNRANLEEGARAGSEAARIALLRLKSAEAGPDARLP